MIGFTAAGLLAIANLLWYELKSELRQKGFPTNLFHHHFGDLRLLRQLSATAGTPEEVMTARRLRNKMRIVWMLSLVAVGLLILLAAIAESNPGSSALQP